MPYTITMIKDDGSSTTLDTFKSYAEADSHLDEWCDKYPNAYIDIWSDTLIH